MILCDKDTCTMCGACVDSCSQNAITMERLKTGFSVPRIDEDLCIECGKCRKSCPVINDLSPSPYIPEAYLAFSNNERILKESASGGVFRELAEYIISQNGIVIGAAWDDMQNVNLCIADTLEEISKFSGSKYVQSNSNHIYSKIHKYLKEGIPVFICALPCQIAALKTYLKKDYKNLYTADIVCHGCASDELFKKYIEYFERKNNLKIRSINHTDKVNGWTRLIQRTICFKTDSNKRIYKDSHEDPYLEGFLSNLYFKEACYTCRFNQMPRCGDITLGDYFGIGVLKRAKKLNKRGVSQIIVNSGKGKKLLSACKNNMYMEKRSIQECMYFNHNLWRASRPHSQHSEFMRDYEHLTYDELADKYFYQDEKGNLKRKIRKIVKKMLGERAVCLLMLFVYKINGTIDQVDAICKKLYDCKQ